MSQTVTKTKGGDAASETKVTPQSNKRKTLTNWRVFSKGGFVPAKIECAGYKGHHPGDMSCHTAFVPTVENVLRHMAPEHGGGWFQIKFRIREADAEGKINEFPLWEQLEEAGVEIQDLYCPHCREQVDLTPRRLLAHLQNHAGANRVNLKPQTLCFTLGYTRPDGEEMDSLYE